MCAACRVPRAAVAALRAPARSGARHIDRRGDDDLGTLCRTRTLRCRIDRPRPIGARCTCEDDEGEEVLGQIVR